MMYIYKYIYIYKVGYRQEICRAVFSIRHFSPAGAAEMERGIFSYPAHACSSQGVQSTRFIQPDSGEGPRMQQAAGSIHQKNLRNCFRL